MTRARVVAFSAMTAIAVPIVVDVGFFVSYLASYAGFCEPHPLDIPARACDALDYAGDFLGDGFAIAGFITINLSVLMVSSIAMTFAALVYIFTFRTEPSRSSARAP